MTTAFNSRVGMIVWEARGPWDGPLHSLQRSALDLVDALGAYCALIKFARDRSDYAGVQTATEESLKAFQPVVIEMLDRFESELTIYKKAPPTSPPSRV